MSKWIRFVLKDDVDPKRKTEQWHVVTAAPKPEEVSGTKLGTISWWGAWRKYAFFPEDGTIFEQQCLRDIADFCERETLNWRARRSSR